MYYLVLVELWLDEAGLGKKEFYDPLRKQLMFPEISESTRELIRTAGRLPHYIQSSTVLYTRNSGHVNVVFNRQLHRLLPHVWHGQVKADGVVINSKFENMSTKKSGFPLRNNH